AYVWFDALINYLSATGFPDSRYERLWPADLHVIGKGITRFHCVIWPAMLLAAELPVPRSVWAHGYVQWSGAKLSKTAGTAVSLDGAIERHGADALRYFLLREIGFAGDRDFTWERFDARYTAELADTLGHLVSRSPSMIRRCREGAVPRGPRGSATAETICGLLAVGGPLGDVRWAGLADLPVEGRQVAPPPILFPKPSSGALAAQNVVT